MKLDLPFKCFFVEADDKTISAIGATQQEVTATAAIKDGCVKIRFNDVRRGSGKTLGYIQVDDFYAALDNYNYPDGLIDVETATKTNYRLGFINNDNIDISIKLTLQKILDCMRNYTTSESTLIVSQIKDTKYLYLFSVSAPYCIWRESEGKRALLRYWSKQRTRTHQKTNVELTEYLRNNPKDIEVGDMLDIDVLSHVSQEKIKEETAILAAKYRQAGYTFLNARL